ncbi:MAG: MscL family protein [Actinomycetes bacterium]
MLKGFREFILRGNVVDLAIAVAIGFAFTALITALGDGLINPLVKVFSGGGVEGGTFEIRGVTFNIAIIINAVITFLITAAVIYFLIVVPLTKLQAFRKTEIAADVPQKQCPECLSSIPVPARRCAFCTAEQTTSSAPGG